MLPVRVVALLLLAAPGVGFAQESPPPPKRERADLAIEARAILRKHCHECHGGGKSRSTLPILDHAKLVATGPNPVPFVAPKNPAASQVIQFIEDGSMPPGGRPRPSPAEMDTLKNWIAEGAPRFPRSFGPSETVQAILDDLGKKPEDAPHLRYLSLAHLLSDEPPRYDIRKAHGDLERALRLAGVKVPPVPVDDAATLFRLDLRKVDWDNRELFYRVAGGKPGGIDPMSAYDVLLLEYPHGPAPADRRLDDYLAKARMARPIPYLRGDWVARALMDEKGNALFPAADLKSLGELSAELRKQGGPALGDERKMPCGPTSRAFGGRGTVPPVEKGQPPSPLPPLGSWYSGDVVPDPAPFPLAVELIDGEGKVLTGVTTDQPFRLKVTTRKNVRFVLLQVWADGQVGVQPTNKNGLFDKEEAVLTPQGSDSFKISGILTGEARATEYFVLLATEAELAPVTIVKSRHARGPSCEDERRYPMYRFFFAPEKRPEGFNPSLVVRKVIPVPVSKAD